MNCFLKINSFSLSDSNCKFKLLYILTRKQIRWVSNFWKTNNTRPEDIGKYLFLTLPTPVCMTSSNLNRVKFFSHFTPFCIFWISCLKLIFIKLYFDQSIKGDQIIRNELTTAMVMEKSILSSWKSTRSALHWFKVGWRNLTHFLLQEPENFRLRMVVFKLSQLFTLVCS